MPDKSEITILTGVKSGNINQLFLNVNRWDLSFSSNSFENKLPGQHQTLSNTNHYQEQKSPNKNTTFNSAITSACPVISFTLSKQNTCTTSSNGAIQVGTPVGGIAPYQYSVDNGLTFQLLNTFSGLSAGTYNVVVKDVNDCLSNPTAVEITSDAGAFVNVGPDQTVCSSEEIHLNATLSGLATGGVWQLNAAFGTFRTPDTDPSTFYNLNTVGQQLSSIKFSFMTNDPSGVCQGGVDELEIFIIPGATVNAGEDIKICATAALPALNGTIGGVATSATWSGGTGTFSPNANTLNATYNPSTAELANGGDIILTLTTNDPDGICPAKSDQLKYTIDQAALVNAGPDQTVCATEEIHLNATLSGLATGGVWQLNAAFGTFRTPDTDPSTFFNLNALGQQLSSIKFSFMTNDPSGVCQGGVDEVEIFIIPAATCNGICSISSAALSNVSACNNNNTGDPSDDFYTADITVEFSNLPATGTLRIEPGNPNVIDPVSIAVGSLVGNSHTFKGVKLRTTGATFAIEVEFSDNNECVRTLTAPAVNSCDVCAISAATLKNVRACNNNGTLDPADDYFTADLVVNFTNPPTTGTLRIEPGNPNVLDNVAIPVNSLAGNSHTFTGVRFKATGAIFSVEIEFSDYNFCVRTIAAPAVASCSNCTLTCPGNITVNSLSLLCGAFVKYPTASGNNCGTFTYSKASGSFFPVGNTIVKVSSSTGAECTFTVTVRDRQNPVIICPHEITTSVQNNSCSKAVSFKVSALDNCPGVTVTTVPASGSVFPVGTTTVTATATDASGNQSVRTFKVRVKEYRAPVINTIAHPIILGWPANSSYQTINVSQFVTSVDDNCNSIPVNAVNIIKVTSDEPENASGNGDGNTTRDIKISSDCKSVNLRRERKAGGNGRVYTIYVAVKDASGNSGIAKFKVFAPVYHGGTTAYDNGTAYSVSCNCDDDYGGNHRSIFIEREEVIVPEGFSLEQNVPNPFQSSTVIRYTIPHESAVNLAVYNAQGQKVAQLVDGKMSAGLHQVNFQASKLAAGIYLYRLESTDNEGNRILVNKKMILAK